MMFRFPSLPLLVVLLAALVGLVSGQSSTGSAATCPTYATVTISGSTTYSYPGFDLFHLTVTGGVSSCASACCATSLCQAYTYMVAATATSNCTAGAECCYLKYQVQDAVAVTDKTTQSAVVVGTQATSPSMQTQLENWELYLSFPTNATIDGNAELATFVAAVLLDISLNLANLTNTSAATIRPYLRLGYAQLDGEYEVYGNYYIMAPVYGATNVSAAQYAAAFYAQIVPNTYTQGTFYAPNSGAKVPSTGGERPQPMTPNLPAPAVLGMPVFDAQIGLSFVPLSQQTHLMNMTQWINEMQLDLATNIAWLTNTNAQAVQPYITIQSPTPNMNPASFQQEHPNSGVMTRFSLTFTVSAYITTVTGPYWTPDVIGQAFTTYLIGGGSQGTFFVPFTASNITIVLYGGQDSLNDIPPGSSSTGVLSSVCQASIDASVTFQASINPKLNVSSPAAFLQMLHMDIASVFSSELSQWSYGYYEDEEISASVLLPYVQLVWPFVSTSAGVSVVESYSAAAPTTTIQPFAVPSTPFLVKFSLNNTMSCILGYDNSVQQLASDMFVGYTYNGQAETFDYYLPSTMINVTISGKQPANVTTLSLTNTPICAASQNAPSCDYFGAVNASYTGSTTVTFTVSLLYPIVSVSDFNGYVLQDIVANFQLLGGANMTQIMPYVIITSISSSASLSSTSITFEVLASISQLSLVGQIVAETFAAQASMGNLSMPLIAYWYGASVHTQSVVISHIDVTTSSSGLASSSTQGGYPLGSEAVSFYVIVPSISSPALFSILIQEDIALNLANITGHTTAQMLPFVVVTAINGSAVSSTGRRLLQLTGPHTSISFVLLGSVTQLGVSASGASIDASTLTAQFSAKAQAGQLQSPNSGATVPAQTVTAQAVGGSSSTGTQSTNGGMTRSSVSVYAVMAAALVAGMAMLM